MPTYDYKCSECGHVFEEFQSITANPLTDCPNCGKPALKRLMAGGAGMIFKGSGFYLTDYGRSNTSKATNSPGGSKPAEKKDSSSGSAASPSPKKD